MQEAIRPLRATLRPFQRGEFGPRALVGVTGTGPGIPITSQPWDRQCQKRWFYGTATIVGYRHASVGAAIGPDRPRCG